jgi:hypothetical protein
VAEPRFVEIIRFERGIENVGRELATDQAVVDPPAGRWLHQTRRVADGQQPSAICLAHRRERKDLRARSLPRLAGYRVPRPDRLRESREERGRPFIAHEADAIDPLPFAQEGHGPPESTRRNGPAEEYLHVVGTVECRFELRALCVRAGNAQAERTIEPVVCPACQDTGTRVHRRGIAVATHRHAIRRDRNRTHACARPQLRARRPSAAGERTIERTTIDDRRPDVVRIHEHGRTVGPDESRRVRGTQNRVPGDIELIERIEAEKAGAVDGSPDLVVLLQHHDVMAGAGERARRDQPGRTSANHRDVAHD